jgi:hypothetical protein
VTLGGGIRERGAPASIKQSRLENGSVYGYRKVHDDIRSQSKPWKFHSQKKTGRMTARRFFSAAICLGVAMNLLPDSIVFWRCGSFFQRHG